MNKNEKFGILFLVLSNLLLIFSFQMYFLSAISYGNPAPHLSTWTSSLIGLKPAFFGWGILFFFFGAYMLFSNRTWRGQREDTD